METRAVSCFRQVTKKEAPQFPELFPNYSVDVIELG